MLGAGCGQAVASLSGHLMYAPAYSTSLLRGRLHGGAGSGFLIRPTAKCLGPDGRRGVCTRCEASREGRSGTQSIHDDDRQRSGAWLGPCMDGARSSVQLRQIPSTVAMVSLDEVRTGCQFQIFRQAHLLAMQLDGYLFVEISVRFRGHLWIGEVDTVL